MFSPYYIYPYYPKKVYKDKETEVSITNNINIFNYNSK